jgi:hypothetical protein
MSTPAHLWSSTARLATLTAVLAVGCGPSAAIDRDGKLPPGIGGVLRADAGAGASRGDTSSLPDAARDSSAPPSPPATDAAASDARTSSRPPVIDAFPGTEASSVATACRGAGAWNPDTNYQPADRVSHGDPLHSFQCRPWPNGLWCAKATYEPANQPGAWVDAWIDEGACP